MKLTAFILLVALAQVSAKSLAQTVTISRNNISLEKVFRDIQKQTGYKFLCTKEQLAQSQLFDIHLNDAPLGEALKQAFKDQPLAYSIFNKTIIVRHKKKNTSTMVPLLPPPIQISGTVTDSATGAPLVGVTIKVKGNTMGTITDANGQFSLEVPDDAVLEVSYLGYKTEEIAVNGMRSIQISLSANSKDLNQVVVVGYSSKRQSQLSSSVTVINADKLKGVSSKSLGSLLQGKVPGLVASGSRGRPESGQGLVIRGQGSIGAGKGPLIVVDGMIGGSYDPNDIASVTVLKDAAATGLYGSRAANGVIIITTKSGHSGKTKITYDGSFGVSKMNFGNLHMMSADELYDLQKKGYKNFYDDRVAAGDPNFTNKTFDQYIQSVLPTSLLNMKTDWQSLLSRIGHVNNQHLAVSGGNKKTTFYLSGNYYKELGTMLNNYYKRMDLRVNIRHQLFNWLTLRTRISAGSIKHPNDPLSGQEGEMSQFYNNMPWDPAFEANGTTPYNPTKPGNTWIGNSHHNFFYDIKHQKDITKSAHFTGDLSLDFKITDWLRFKTQNRIYFSGNDRSQIFDKFHQSASFEGGQVMRNFSYHNNLLTSNLLYLDHSFGKNNFSVILGQEYQYDKNKNTRAVGVDIAEGLDALSATGSAKDVSGAKVEETFLSFFGQIDYNYNDRYFLVGSLRGDASSLFGSNNRWATFYSIGGSWLINEENFLRDVSWINLLKLRASYGVTGNANITPYLALGTFSFTGNSVYDHNAGAWPERISNPNLTWEEAHSTNIGLDLSVFNRVKIDLDFYNRINKNLLQNVPFPATSGFSGAFQNVGSVRNQGVNFSVSSINIITSKFKWSTSINFSLNKNKVISLYNHDDISKGYRRIREGLPLNYIYMRKWAGVDPQTGEALWVRWEDKDGNLINGSDKVEPTKITTTNNYNNASLLFIRTAFPNFTGGFINNLEYRNFSFRIITNFVKGQYIYNQARERRDADGNSLNQNQRKLMTGWSRWEKPGDIATHPRYISGGGSASNRKSSRYLENGSYFRIQNVRLGYEFPLNKSFFSNLTLYLSVDNPIVFTQFSGSDPGINIGSPQVTQNSGNGEYSTNKRLIIGLHLEF